MNVKLKDAGACRRNLEIKLDSEKVGEEYRNLLDEYVKEAKLPGFRKGRAPQKMVEKKFSKELREDVEKRLVAEAYRDAVDQEDLDVLAVLDMDSGEFDPASEFSFTVTLDVPPDFKLPGYKGIKLKGEDAEPSADDVDRAMQNLLEQYARYAEITERPVQRDDMVKIDYRATVDGKPLEEVAPENADLGEKQDYWVLINENAFLPEMQEGLIGCEIGDEKDIDVQFADDFPQEALAGRQAVYRVKVQAIRAKVIPELDEEMLQKFDVESEEELRGKIQEHLSEAAAEREKTRLRDAICSHLLKKTKIDAPESQVQRMMENIIKDIVRRNMSEGVSRDQIEEKRDEIFKEAQRMAEERVKLSYIIDRIAEQEEVEVNESDVREYLERQARHHNVPVEQLYSRFEQEESALDNLRVNLRNNKTIDVLLEQAVIKK